MALSLMMNYRKCWKKKIGEVSGDVSGVMSGVMTGVMTYNGYNKYMYGRIFIVV